MRFLQNFLSCYIAVFTRAQRFEKSEFLCMLKVTAEIVIYTLTTLSNIYTYKKVHAQIEKKVSTFINARGKATVGLG